MLEFLLKASRLPTKSFSRLILLIVLSWGLSVLGQQMTPKNLAKVTDESVRLAKRDTRSLKFYLYSLDEFGNRELISPNGADPVIDERVLMKQFLQGKEYYFLEPQSDTHRYALPIFSQQKNLIGYIYCEFSNKPTDYQIQTMKEYANFYSILVMLS